MCRICVEYQLGKLTAKEALRNAGEIVRASDDPEERDHLFRVIDKVADDEIQSNHAGALERWETDGGVQ